MVLFLAAAVTFGCMQKEMPLSEGQGTTRLCVELEDTRTSVSAPDAEGFRTVTWLKGDQINVNGQTSNPLETGGSSTAEFTFANPVTAPFKVIYPASFYKDATHIVLPYSQNKMSGGDNLATDTFPMYGEGSSIEHLPTKHLCTILKFQVNLKKDGESAPPTITYIEFFGNNGEQVCGEFAIDYATGELTGVSTSALSKSVRCFSLKTSANDSTIICNMVVPAGTYSKGFTIRVADGSGKYMEKVLGAAKTFAPGEARKYPAFDYVPNGKLDALCITTAEQLIAFAKDWNAYKFEAKKANVTFLSDIVFDETTSAAFVATGGIGTSKVAGDPTGTLTNHYNGIIDGNGFSIKNLTSTVPLVATAGGSAVIKNIIIDTTCAFTCTATGSSDWGVIVGRQKGDLLDCEVNATVTIEANTADYERNIGGVVGRPFASNVQNCTMKGTINFPSGTITDAKSIYIGGIAGATGSTGTTITDCSFEGKINLSDGTTYGGPGYTSSKTWIVVGGILGNILSGTSVTVDGCTSSAAASIIMGGKYATYVGGIVGGAATAVSSSIKNCSNAAEVKFCSNEARANTTPTYLAGILGNGNATVSVSNCNNSGKIYSYCNSTTYYIGGIVAYAKSTVDKCNNSGEVYRYNGESTAAQRNRYMSVGGIVGYLIAKGEVSNCTNSGKMYSQDRCTATQTTCDVGGIVGTTQGSNKITNCECTSPEIRSRGDKGSNPNTAVARDLIGGIAGNLVSTKVEGCTVSNVPLINLYSGNCFQGGIAGTMDVSSSIKDCKVIDCSCNFNNTATANKLAAICAVTASGSAINDCQLSGKWSTDAGTNWTPFTLDNVTSGTSFSGSGNALYTKVYNLTGKVSCGSKGLKGVVVSDGCSSTLTDASGNYYLQTCDSTTCVSVSIPSGYMVSSTGGVPAFWKKLSTVSEVGGIKTVNFTLNQISNPEKFTIFMYADVQVRPASGFYYDGIAFHSGEMAKDLFSDIADRAAATGGNVIGISLGDQIHEVQSALTNYYLSANELGKLNFPNFSLMGNHDYDLTASDFIGGAANFESKLAPVRYSYNVGKYHVIVLDNARTQGVGSSHDPLSECKGLGPTPLQWLKSDLKYVPTTTPIILCTHRELFMEMYRYSDGPALRDISTRTWAQGTEYAGILSGYKKVYAFNGDAHCMFNYVYPSGAKRNIEVHTVPRATGELWVNQFLNKCGTPRGYLEIKIDGDDLTYKFKPVAYQTGSCAGGPSPMTYRDFSLTSGKFYMKSGYLSAPGELLDDFYQIHAYAPGSGYGAATKYPNDVIATIFMYDNRWSDVTFEYEGGSTTMTRIALDEDLRDPGYSWQFAWYKANNSQMKSDASYANTFPLYNAFRCTPPAGVKTGTVKVTDHFGNNYEYKISW